MTIFMSSFSSLQNFLIFLALVRYLQRQEKRSFENALSSYDPSASLFSTLDSESSAVLHLDPPKKRTKLSDITFSSGEEDEVLGNIHPSNKSKTTFLLEEDTNFDQVAL